MSYPVHYVPAGDVLPIFFDTFDGGTGASITMTGLAVTDIEIYKDGSTTQRASDAGYTLLDTDGIDFDGITGIHGFSIDTGDNTDAGFYTVGAWFHVVVSAVTVDAQTVSFIAAAFRLMPAEGVAGKPKVDVDTFGGTAGTFASGRAEVNTSHIAGSSVSTSSAQIGVNVVNAGGTAWASGSLTSGVFASGAITAGAIAADAIGASELAADAVAEIADAVWDEDATGHQTGGTFGQAIGDPGANAATIYAAVVTDAAGTNIAADIIAIKAETASILTDTAEIGTAGAGLTNINLPDQTMNITGNITGNLSGSVGSVTGAVGSVTGNVGGNVTGTIGGLTAGALADLFDTDSGTNYASAVAGSVVKEIADNAGGSALTAAAIADAVWDEAQADHVVAGTFGEVATETGAIKTKTDSLNFTVAGKVDANTTHINETEITGDGSTTPWGPV